LDRGQVTIEFILILVVMLTVLATLSIPLAKDVAEQTIDTGVAVSLASSVQRVAQAAEEVSYSGCGSFKTVPLYFDPDPFSIPSLLVDNENVWGNYSDMVDDVQRTKKIPYPKYIKMTVDCQSAGNTYTVKVEKDCTVDRHNPVHVTSSGSSQTAIAFTGNAC
jgi:hypothetical protein